MPPPAHRQERAGAEEQGGRGFGHWPLREGGDFRSGQRAAPKREVVVERVWQQVERGALVANVERSMIVGQREEARAAGDLRRAAIDAFVSRIVNERDQLPLPERWS